MKHTPGPWRAVLTYVHSVREDRRTTTSVADCGLTPSRAEEAQANARLIAAAPELLEACKELVAVSEQAPMMVARCGPWLCRIVRNARAAIAKAEGTT